MSDIRETLRSQPIRIGISTRSLFNLEEEHAVFVNEGVMSGVRALIPDYQFTPCHARIAAQPNKMVPQINITAIRTSIGQFGHAGYSLRSSTRLRGFWYATTQIPMPTQRTPKKVRIIAFNLNQATLILSTMLSMRAAASSSVRAARSSDMPAWPVSSACASDNSPTFLA